jgi:hypothetical protein
VPSIFFLTHSYNAIINACAHEARADMGQFFLAFMLAKSAAGANIKVGPDSFNVTIRAALSDHNSGIHQVACPHPSPAAPSLPIILFSMLFHNPAFRLCDTTRALGPTPVLHPLRCVGHNSLCRE